MGQYITEKSSAEPGAILHMIQGSMFGPAVRIQHPLPKRKIVGDW